MNIWQTLVMWFTVGYTSFIVAGILLGTIVVSSFLTWLIARHSWKCHEEKRLPEITRAKLRERDERIFHLRRELAIKTEQVETLSVNQRTALSMLYQSAGLLHSPAIASEIEIRRKAK